MKFVESLDSLIVGGDAAAISIYNFKNGKFVMNLPADPTECIVLEYSRKTEEIMAGFRSGIINTY